MLTVPAWCWERECRLSLPAGPTAYGPGSPVVPSLCWPRMRADRRHRGHTYGRLCTCAQCGIIEPEVLRLPTAQRESLADRGAWADRGYRDFTKAFSKGRSGRDPR